MDTKVPTLAQSKKSYAGRQSRLSVGGRADYLWKLELSIKDVTSGKTKYAYSFCHLKCILLVENQQYFRLSWSHFSKEIITRKPQVALRKKQQIRPRETEHLHEYYLRITEFLFFFSYRQMRIQEFHYSELSSSSQVSSTKNQS